MNTYKIFFTKEYMKYEESLIEFRKKILLVIQISTTLLGLVFIVIVFPFQTVPISYYIILPSYLIINNVISTSIRRKRFEKFCPYYLLFQQILGQVVSFELSLRMNVSYRSNFSLYFLGLYVGILQIICFLNFSSSLHKILISVVLLVQITIKQVEYDFENIYTRVPMICCVLIFVNYAYFKTEALNFQMWSALLKRNESLQNFQKLIEYFPSPILTISRDSFNNDKPLYCNREAELTLEGLVENKSVQAFLECFKLKKKMDERSSNETSFTLRGLILSYIHAPEPEAIDYKGIICEKADCEKWEAKISWFEWNQKEVLIIILSDLSKMEKIRELKELDKNKNRILATVSHELRTPINGIIGMLEHADRFTSESQELKYFLSIAKNSAKTLLLMVNDLLDIEQLRNGKLRLNIEKKSLQEIVDKVLPLIEIQIREKKLELIYENKCPENTQVLVDSARLQQVLWNLLWNACKFTSSGHIKLMAEVISIKSFESDEGNLMKPSKYQRLPNYESENYCNSDDEAEHLLVELSVEDTGMGIESKKLKDLFKDFGKLESDCNPTGVGLGLSISQSLVKQMNSTGIQVKSEYGKGSKFSFKIRAEIKKSHSIIINEMLVKGKKTSAFHSENLEKAKENTGKSFKILLVDDDLVNHLVFDNYLHSLSASYIKDKAFNGLDAINLILERASKQEYYDLILMDCCMPLMDGFKATLSIKELINAGNIPDVKIIGLTANSNFDEKDRCLEVGMLEVWTKPIPQSEFIKNVGCVLKVSIERK